MYLFYFLFFILYCATVILSILFSSLVFISRYKSEKYIKANNLQGKSLLFFGDINKIKFTKNLMINQVLCPMKS